MTTRFKEEASLSDIEKLCREAIEYGFASVMVNPCNVGVAAKAAEGSGVKVGTVIGFPLGANTTAVKVFVGHGCSRKRCS